MASTSGPGAKPPLTPMLEGFGKPNDQREAALSEYGKQLGSVELELDDDEPDPSEMARRASGKTSTSAKPAATASAKPAATASAKPAATASAKPATTASAKPAATASTKPAVEEPEVALASTSDVRPTLEPISDDTHKHRRLPTQPPSALALDLDAARSTVDRVAARPATGASATSAAPHSRQSPAPVRRRLFSGDRITNFLASFAVGLVIMIFPAKQFALRYELREVEPLLADLEGAIEHPLGVQAGLVADPQKIAAQIHEGREHVRHRYLAIWLLVGLPLGLGLGFAPRPGD